MYSIVKVVWLLAAISLSGASLSPLGRVLGGTEVNIRQYPYIVSVRFNDKHVCGGSIVSPNSILSAAHCMNYVGNAEVSVRVGSSINSQGEPFKVVEVFLHDRYDPRTMQFDVAIMRLAKPLKYGLTVQPVSLATMRPLAGTTTIVIGWGQFAVGSTMSSNLRAAAIPLVESIICAEQYTKVQMKITSQMVCAANKDGSVSSCPGDSGGPLIDASSRKLVGIVSFGQGCGTSAPAVYASVPDLHAWIVNLL